MYTLALTLAYKVQNTQIHSQVGFAYASFIGKLARGALKLTLQVGYAYAYTYICLLADTVKLDRRAKALTAQTRTEMVHAKSPSFYAILVLPDGRNPPKSLKTQGKSRTKKNLGKSAFPCYTDRQGCRGTDTNWLVVRRLAGF